MLVFPILMCFLKLPIFLRASVENPFTNSGTYYLGIDGGGTKKALALSDEEGNIIRIHKTEGCNPVDIGIDRVKEILKDAIYEICKDISLSSVYCFAGIAGGDSAIPQCDSKWTLENKVPEGTRFFERNPERFNICYKWMNNFDFKPSADKYKWTNPCDGIFYHPYRISDMESTDSLFELCEKYCKAMPIKIQSAKGYLSSVFETDKEYIVHFLAADYDTDIDHKLDEMRYHRSLINYINKVEPIGIDGKITIEAQNVPLVYTPFNDDTYEVILKDGVCNIKLPEKCSYVILKFNK